MNRKTKVNGEKKIDYEILIIILFCLVLLLCFFRFHLILKKQANLQQNKKDALMEKIKEKLDEEKDWEKKNNKDDEEKNKSEW